MFTTNNFRATSSRMSARLSSRKRDKTCPRRYIIWNNAFQTLVEPSRWYTASPTMLKSKQHQWVPDPSCVNTLLTVDSFVQRIQLEEGHLKSFLDNSKALPFVERGELLVKSQGIIDTHKELAQEGQTEVWIAQDCLVIIGGEWNSNFIMLSCSQAPGEDSPVNHHFVAFIQKDGSLYELGQYFFLDQWGVIIADQSQIESSIFLFADGRQSVPVNHGPSSPETFLEDATRVCQEYMARDPDEVRFTIVALASNE